ncbi:anthranilate synthase component I [Campylobacter sp. MIT 99-7217]|nr:anthranilate synthase component I [Campylobacter sp. MIT 99-7217]
MLSKEANFYYRQILEKYPFSYFAEDKDKIIIGIDPLFLDSKELDFSSFKAKFYEKTSQRALCKEAGFFGVLSFDFIHLFERLEKLSLKSYDFPLFLFADAKAYLVYEKNTKIYYEYGDKAYFSFLKEEEPSLKEKKELKFKILSDLKEEEKKFLSMVKEAKQYLLSGDIFQVVLSKQLCIEHNISSFDFYEALSKENPSPYMFHFPSKYGVVLGSSPELVLSIKNKELFVAPIAGTRNLDSKSDIKALQEDLLSDEKELCEHKMLVDLARNDLAKFGTEIEVKNAFSVQIYQFVMHIVSEVYASLRKDASIFDAISAVFPAGTLSGAPKIRALELIAQLERLNRGVYGGAIGFLRFNEDALLAILIRSAFFKDNKAYLASGAGIVLASKAQKEYEEIKAKRRSLLALFEKLCSKNSNLKEEGDFLSSAKDLNLARKKDLAKSNLASAKFGKASKKSLTKGLKLEKTSPAKTSNLELKKPSLAKNSKLKKPNLAKGSKEKAFSKDKK